MGYKKQLPNFTILIGLIKPDHQVCPVFTKSEWIKKWLTKKEGGQIYFW